MARNVTAKAAHFRRGLNFLTLGNKPFIHPSCQDGRPLPAMTKFGNPWTTSAMADWEEGYKGEIPLRTELSKKNVHREDTRPFLRMNMVQLLKLENPRADVAQACDYL